MKGETNFWWEANQSRAGEGMTLWRMYELARFTLHQFDTEERKTRRFEQSLKPWLYNRLLVLQIDNFATLGEGR